MLIGLASFPGFRPVLILSKSNLEQDSLNSEQCLRAQKTVNDIIENVRIFCECIERFSTFEPALNTEPFTIQLSQT